MLKLCSGTFSQSFAVSWCHSGHYYQAVTSNVAFTHLHFESPCFVCVYTSFTFVFYQFYAAVFAESAFFIMEQFWVVAVSPGSFSEASSYVFVAVTFALLGFCISGTFGFAMQCVLHIYIIVCIYICFLQYFLVQCILRVAAWSHISYIVRPCRPCFLVWTPVCCSVFYSIM